MSPSKTRLLAAFGVVMALTSTQAAAQAQAVAFRDEVRVLSAPGSAAASAEVADFMASLLTAQNAYFEVNQRYAARLEDLPAVVVPPGIHLTMTAGKVPAGYRFAATTGTVEGMQFTMTYGATEGPAWWQVAVIHENAPGSTWVRTTRPEEVMANSVQGRI